MRLTTREEFDSAPEAVFALIADEEFQQAKCAATSTGKYSVSVTRSADHVVVRSERHLPSDGLPDAARPFVGAELTVVEVQTWGPAEPDGTRRASVDLHVKGAPLTLKAEVALTPAGHGALELLDGELKATVPFIGGLIEQAAAEPILSAVGIGASTLREFLAR